MTAEENEEFYENLFRDRYTDKDLAYVNTPAHTTPPIVPNWLSIAPPRSNYNTNRNWSNNNRNYQSNRNWNNDNRYRQQSGNYSQEQKPEKRSNEDTNEYPNKRNK